VKPDGLVVPRNVGHPVGGGGSGLCRKLHISFHLSDVLDDPWVRDNVAHGLVIQEIPRVGNAVVGLGEDCALVDLGDRAVFAVLSTLDWPIAGEDGLAEESPVLRLVVGRVGNVLVHCIDKLAHITLIGFSIDELADTLVWLLGLAEDCHLVLAGITLDGGVSICATALTGLLLISCAAGSTGSGESLFSHDVVGIILLFVVLRESDAHVEVGARVLTKKSGQVPRVFLVIA
jgi:hypothetical protein